MKSIIMQQENNSDTGSIHKSTLAKRMLTGGAIALILIIAFLFPVKSNPEWSKFWMIRPLIIVPLAGATGGFFYHFMDHLRNRGGWRMVLANVISVIIYVFGLWIGTVLGLAGTLWD